MTAPVQAGEPCDSKAATPTAAWRGGEIFRRYPLGSHLRILRISDLKNKKGHLKIEELHFIIVIELYHHEVGPKPPDMFRPIFVSTLSTD